MSVPRLQGWAPLLTRSCGDTQGFRTYWGEGALSSPPAELEEGGRPLSRKDGQQDQTRFPELGQLSVPSVVSGQTEVLPLGGAATLIAWNRWALAHPGTQNPKSGRAEFRTTSLGSSVMSVVELDSGPWLSRAVFWGNVSPGPVLFPILLWLSTGTHFSNNYLAISGTRTPRGSAFR